jgi:hypothetical protein
MSQNSTIGKRAQIANPALQPLEFLIGRWRTIGSHPQVPDKALHGRTSFAWHEGGAFLIMRTEVDEPQFPNGLAIIGSDDSAGKFIMSYFDERGTSRIFQVMVGNGTVTWHRDDPKFSQLTVITAEAGDTLIGKGRMSKDRGAWVDDLSQVYEREE